MLDDVPIGPRIRRLRPRDFPRHVGGRRVRGCPRAASDMVRGDVSRGVVWVAELTAARWGLLGSIDGHQRHHLAVDPELRPGVRGCEQHLAGKNRGLLTDVER